MSKTDVLPLNAETLPALRSRITVPEYDRESALPRILHLGVGGFHRAHMAYLTDALLASGRGNWVINGVGLTPHDERMAATMESQDGLYTLVSRSAADEQARVVGSITNYFFEPDGAGSLAHRAAEEDYRIFSLTVTENGYHYTGSDRHLDTTAPEIAHDLQHPDEPQSAVGLVFRVAQLRIRGGRRLPTFLSCDNLPQNGNVLRGLVLEFGRHVDPETTMVLEAQGCFPNTMVDRITPATEDKDRDYVRDTWGIEDSWPVVCEDFIQWFIEDEFSYGRPAWEAVGAVIVEDVTPYEYMKIRLLNGAHSALAYIAYLLGFRNVDDAMADADVRAFVRRYMKEMEPSVGEVPGVDVEAYQEKLIERFSNPAIRDQVLRLCEDGSRKIPNMMLDPLSELIPRGLGYRHAAFAMAAWIRFLQGTDPEGNEIPIKDPNAAQLSEAARRCSSDVRPFLALDTVFSDEIRSHDTLVNEMSQWFTTIAASGPRAAIRRLLEGA